MPVRPIPEGFHAVTPYLRVKDAAAAIDFYVEALRRRRGVPAGRSRRARSCTPRSGSGDSVADALRRVPRVGRSPGRRPWAERPSAWPLRRGRRRSATDRAVAAGAIGADARHRPVLRRPDRARSATRSATSGPSATHKEDVSPEEIRRRFEAWMVGPGPPESPGRPGHRSRTRAIFRLPTRTIRPSATSISAFGSVDRRSGRARGRRRPCSMTRRAFEVLVSSPRATRSRGQRRSGPSASSWSRARTTSGISSGSSRRRPPPERLGRGLGGLGAVVLGDDRPAQDLLGVARVHARGRAGASTSAIGQVGQEGEVLPHRPVGHAHHLAELVVGGLGHADVVAQALAHPPDAVGADQDRHRHRHLPRPGPATAGGRGRPGG